IWRSSKEQRARGSFVRLTWLEFRLPARKNVLKSFIAKIGATLVHTVAKVKICFEIRVLQSFFQLVRFVRLDGDEVGVEFIRPVIGFSVVPDVWKFAQGPGNGVIAGQKNETRQFCL